MNRLACLPAALLASASLSSAAPSGEVTLAEPVLVQASDKMLAEGRPYPSPSMFDMNGDGRLDVVVGDLFGHITYAIQKEDGSFGAEQKLQDAKKAIIDFGNW